MPTFAAKVCSIWKDLIDFEYLGEPKRSELIWDSSQPPSMKAYNAGVIAPHLEERMGSPVEPKMEADCDAAWNSNGSSSKIWPHIHKHPKLIFCRMPYLPKQQPYPGPVKDH